MTEVTMFSALYLKTILTCYLTANAIISFQFASGN